MANRSPGKQRKDRIMTHPDPDQDLLEIKRVIELYFDGTHFSDGDKMAEAFVPGCQIIGRTMRAERDDWIADIRKRTSPASQDAPYAYRILSIEIDDGIALDRLSVPINGMLFTDVATLLKLDDGWRIVTKVFFRKQ